MTDFHIILSENGAEGCLNAASALRYASLAGLHFAALVLPSDGSDFFRISAFVKNVHTYSLYANVEARAGVELRHVPPPLIPTAVKEAREAGAELVLVYGESLCSQVEEGTNFAAVEAGADILAHPGLIDEKTAAFAAEKNVALEFTSCPRHALANAHTAAMALRFHAPLVRGSAARRPQEITPRAFWPFIIKGADVFYEDGSESNLLNFIRKSEDLLIRRLMKA